MRWERLFADLEGMVDEHERAHREAEIADRVRRELARVELSDRLRANDGRIELLLRGGRLIRGDLIDAGSDWLVVDERHRGEVLVPVHAIIEVSGLGRSVAAPSDPRRLLSLRQALRVLARHRVGVIVEDELRRVRTGTIDIVGADFFELAQHPLDMPRRGGTVLASRVIPYRAVVAVTTNVDQRASSPMAARAGSANSAVSGSGVSAR